MARRPHPGPIAFATVALLTTVAIAGCGTRVRSELSALSSTTLLPAATTSSTLPATTTTVDVAAATAQITSNWEAFFNAQTPLAKRESLLENGAQYEQAFAIASQNQFYAKASAQVVQVQLNAPGQAKVTYNLLVSGHEVVPNATGAAVLQGGVWKVSDQSFCGLATLSVSTGTTVPGCS
jgi:hypothetical protein